jgi:class 3 adenylate cyclase/tetratricopeptide (TPR) repeat protein
MSLPYPADSDHNVLVPASGEVRKTVTVLFSDVADSTPLGEALDPESTRAVMSRYFDAVQGVLERHGGTVEKFIGDAVMAVFGVPVLHEDDALRAVRAAAEINTELARLNNEFERTWGVTITNRTGVETGEVIAGDPGRGQPFVVGDSVNTAARLEQSAHSGEILVGEATFRLVHDAVVAEPAGPLEMKGKSRPIEAWRVLAVVPGVPGWNRRLDSPLVGRERERDLLGAMFEQSVAERSCKLVTVVGAAGIGKSRLTNDFVRTVGATAIVATGRCLSYGEGITFWPLVEVLRDLAGISERDSVDEVRRRISDLVPPDEDAELVRERLSAVLGLGVAPGMQETFWAVRRLFEQLGERPLVVVFDDIHWAEPTFLDLLEYLALWIHDTPVLLVCLARPDFLELRPGWMTTNPNSRQVSLQALNEDESNGLITNLVGGAEVHPSARARIAELAEGNPLFVEETLRMLVDDGLLEPGEGGWSVKADLSNISIPTTIQTLLTARLERLPQTERAVLERASVVGRVFWSGALSALCVGDVCGELPQGLQSLVRKELIRPDHSEARRDDAFRFAHILVRDAAYRGLPKTTRAELHERLVDWFETKEERSTGDYETILGYHLEEAHRSLLELSPASDRTDRLGKRGGTLLAVAGRQAFARGDMPAAVNLLTRAVELLPSTDRERLECLPSLAFALLETGDLARLESVADEMTEAAAASGDPGVEAHAALLRLWIRLYTDPEGWAEDALKEATRTITVFAQLGDEQGLARSWSLLGLVHLYTTQFRRAEEAWERASLHAHRADNHREELESLSWVPICVWAGPTPADEALQRCETVIERARGDKKAVSTALFVQAELEAGLGRFDPAQELLARSRALLEELALTVWIAGPLTQFAGWIELWRGDPAAAETQLRWGRDTLSDIGEMAWLPTVDGILAEALHVQSRDDEAEELTRSIEESAGSEDVYSQVLWRGVYAKVLARRGDVEEAERLARESLSLVGPTDFLHGKWYAHMTLAEVLGHDGRLDEAQRAVGDAVQAAEEKGHLVRAELARDLGSRLGTFGA